MNVNSWRYWGSHGRRVIDRFFPANFAVLNYHRIGPVVLDPWDLAVSPRRFDEQVSVLKKAGRIVPLSADGVGNGFARAHSRDRRFALTFDDGYADNLYAAIDVLERHAVPATVFVATTFLDQRSFWWERVAELICDPARSARTVVDACERVGLLPRAWPDAKLRTHSDIHTAVYDRLNGRDQALIDGELDELARALGEATGTVNSRPLTTDELVELAKHPLISIGVHTVNHRRLVGLEDQVVFDEMTRCRNTLDHILGRAERDFAYPHGDADRRTAKVAASAGFRCAVTTDDRWVSPLDHVLLLPRLHPTDMDGESFGRWLHRR